MCGIICYCGKKQAVPILINGLKRLEYRGYDSAGLAVVTNTESRKNGKNLIVKTKGRVSQLEKKQDGMDLEATFGIGVAPAGPPTEDPRR